MSQARTLGGGRWLVGELIGRGGFCRVHAAFDTQLAVARAVKLLPAGGPEAAEARVRLRAEARILARLDHPNLVAVYDAGADGDEEWIVVEHVGGGTLAERIEAEGRLAPAEAIRIACGVLDGLAAAHAAGVVHRDVKPANILLAPDGVPKLADFGIARLEGESSAARTATGTSLGTVAFMAPEQRLDAARAGPPADLYATGATVYAAITGGTPVDLFTARPDSPRWAGIPEPLAAVLQAAVARDPAARPADARALAAALQGALAQVAPDERRRPLPAPREPPRPSGPRFPVVAATVAALAAGLAVWMVRAPAAETLVTRPPAVLVVEPLPAPAPPTAAGEIAPDPFGAWSGRWNRAGKVALVLEPDGAGVVGRATVSVAGGTARIAVGGTWDPATGALVLRDRDAASPEAGTWALSLVGDALVGSFRANHREQRFSLHLRRLTSPPDPG